nr:hypothetical protein P5621_09855 [Bacillus subtilis]
MAPIWDRVQLEKRSISPADERVVILGGDDNSRKAVQREFPFAKELYIEPNASIHRITEASLKHSDRLTTSCGCLLLV